MFVLKTGPTWRELPREAAGGAGAACWRRLRGWAEAGVSTALHELPAEQLRALERLDLDTVVVDGSHGRALGGRRSPRPPIGLAPVRNTM